MPASPSNHALKGRTTTGKIATVVQRTAFEAYRGLNFAAKGLMGEHIVEHHVIEKSWGLGWDRHDMKGGRAAIKAAGKQSSRKSTTKYGMQHSQHDVQREFGESDLDAAETQYKISGKQGKTRKPKRPRK